LRIIAGSARGTRLKAPVGMGTRPTADRIKESLFSILGQLLAGRRVLDLFAGTGALGLEALSRGAADAVLVDQATAPIIRENARRAHFEAHVGVVSSEVFLALTRLCVREVFDLVFCDPPYHKGLSQRALLFFDTSPVLAYEGILVIEHGADEEMPEELKSLVRVDFRTYGKTTSLSFYERREYLEET